MISLDDSRKKIDEIDNKLMQLFEERMKIVVDVAMYKKQHNLEIFQSDREKQVIAKNVAKINDDNIKKYGEDFLNDLMKVSRAYQSEMLNR